MEIFEKNLIDATMENDNDAKFLHVDEKFKKIVRGTELKSTRDNQGGKMGIAGSKDLWKIKKGFYSCTQKGG